MTQSKDDSPTRRTPADAKAGSRTSRQKPPTIDLEATIVAPKTEAETATDKTKTAGATKSVAKKTAATKKTRKSAAGKKTSRATKKSATTQTGKSASPSSPSSPPGPSSSSSPKPSMATPPPSASRGSLIGYGAAAFAGSVLALMGSWFLQGGASEKIDTLTQAHDTRLTRLEQITDASTKVDTSGAIDAVAGNVQQLQSDMSGLKGSLAALQTRMEDLDRLRAQMATLQTGLEAQTSNANAKTTQRFSGVETTLQSLVNEIRALKQTEATLYARVDAVEARDTRATQANQAATLALGLVFLKRAVDAGTAYESELRTIEAIVGADPSIKPLQPFAASGIPSTTHLAGEFADVAAHIVTTGASQENNTQSLSDRLFSGAKSYLGVRRTGSASGDAPDAIVARIQARLDRGDIDGAVDEYDGLNPAAKEIGKPWLTRLKAAGAARAAMNTLITSTLAALTRLSQMPGTQ